MTKNAKSIFGRHIVAVVGTKRLCTDIRPSQTSHDEEGALAAKIRLSSNRHEVRPTTECITSFSALK